MIQSVQSPSSREEACSEYSSEYSTTTWSYFGCQHVEVHSDYQGFSSHAFKKVTVIPDQKELWHCCSLQNIAALQHWVSRMQKIPLLCVSTEGASREESEWGLFITTFKGTKSPGRVKNIFLSPVPAKSFPFQFCHSLPFILGLCWQSQIVAVQIIGLHRQSSHTADPCS